MYLPKPDENDIWWAGYNYGLSYFPEKSNIEGEVSCKLSYICITPFISYSSDFTKSFDEVELLKFKKLIFLLNYSANLKSVNFEKILKTEIFKKYKDKLSLRLDCGRIVYQIGFGKTDQESVDDAWNKMKLQYQTNIIRNKTIEVIWKLYQGE